MCLAQVEVALRDLQQTDMQRLLAALETLARLAWNDDEVPHLELPTMPSWRALLSGCHSNLGETISYPACSLGFPSILWANDTNEALSLCNESQLMLTSW